jgi:AcrR family transcriptional regulator
MKLSSETATQSEQASPLTARRAPTLRRHTWEKILAGTMSAIAERGVGKLSMSNIGQHAGVSRATLYQYFAAPEEVLAVVAEQLCVEFRRGLQLAVKDCSAPWERLNIISQYLDDHARVQSFEDFMRHQSQFVIEAIRQHFDSYVAAVQEALDPVVDALQIEFGCTLNRRLCAEVLLRNQFSTMLIPGKGKWLDLPALLAALQLWLASR